MAISGRFKGKSSLCVFAGQSLTSFVILFLSLGTGFTGEEYTNTERPTSLPCYNIYFFSVMGMMVLALFVAIPFVSRGKAVQYYFNTKPAAQRQLLDPSISPPCEVQVLEVRVCMYVCICTWIEERVRRGGVVCLSSVYMCV
jgi:hypothetical protein